MWVKFDANSRLALRVFLRLLWGPIHTTPEEYENRGFTPKIHQMFFVILDLCLLKTRADKSPDYRDVIIFEKLCFQNVLCPH